MYDYNYSQLPLTTLFNNHSPSPKQLGSHEFDSVQETVISCLSPELVTNYLWGSESESYGSPSSWASSGTQQPSLIQQSCHGPVSSISWSLQPEGPTITSRGSDSYSMCSENDMIIEGMSRASRYSPEERKERIERYRSKRNQRNFNKKIKYACRKTLADNRRRIKGRFARNEETGNNSPTQWSHYDHDHHQDDHDGEGDDQNDNYDDKTWNSFLDAYFCSRNLIP